MVYNVLTIAIRMFKKLRKEVKGDLISTDDLYKLIQANYMFTRKQTIIKTIKSLENFGMISQSEELGVWKINWKKIENHRKHYLLFEGLKA